MFGAETLNRIKTQIFTQELSGSYKNYSFRTQFRKMLTLGVVTTILGIFSLLTFSNTSTDFIEYNSNTKSMILSPCWNKLHVHPNKWVTPEQFEIFQEY